MKAHARGQTLALFALTMLLLVLMVCMTLSFGTKAKEKMELQQAADMAAYSNAVAVARTFNAIAVHNRAIIAHHVALLGVQSSISFASSWLAYVDALLISVGLEMVARQCPPCCRPTCGSAICRCWGCPIIVFTRLIPLLLERARVLGTIGGLDAAASTQARANAWAATALYAAEVLSYRLNLYDGAIGSQRLAGQVLSQLSGGRAEFQNAPGADTVALEELGGLSLVPDGAVMTSPVSLILSKRHGVMAAHAARGHPYQVNRCYLNGAECSLLPSGIRTPMLTAFQRVGVGNDLQSVWHLGSSYFGPQVHTRTPLIANSSWAWGDDHGQGVYRYSGAGCSPGSWPFAAASIVQARSNLGVHVVGSGVTVPLPGPGPDFIPIVFLLTLYGDAAHQLGGFSIPPGAFSNFLDYNMLKVWDASDNFAQPKLPVVFHRDYRQRPSGADPFNLFLNMRFTPAGQAFDMRSADGLMLSDGTDVSRSVALSTGIAYYHRADHWREPPNLFNPFWRAGLTRNDIDQEARTGGDIPRVLSAAGSSWAADAYNRLYASGYRGY